ncbi:MAG TPA: hypothetical protein PK095_00840 [Myxococcota bacterium]|nr:hypothetical protein [Myxococcota bacterium]
MPDARPPAPMLRLLLALLLITSLAGPATARPRPTWRQAPGIEIKAELRPHIEAVARIYFEKTRRPLEITSGYRSPRRQAEAMYVKLAVGGSLALYKRQDLTRPLLDAYRQGRKKRWKKDRIVAAMAEVLQSQVERGQYLSRHMRGLAFDVRSTGMSAKQRQALLAAVREVGQMRIIRERRPPHYHIEVIIPRAPRKVDPDVPSQSQDDQGDDDGEELLEREEP